MWLLYISFIVVTMNSRDQYEIIGLFNISHSTKQPCRNFCLKNVRNASKMLKQCSTLVKQSEKSNNLIYSKLLKFQTLPKFHLADCLLAYLLAVRPSSTRFRPPDLYQVMYHRVEVTNLLIH